MGVIRRCFSGRRSSFAWSVLLLMTAGCGNDGLTVTPVSGKVSYRGKPLVAGVIYFVPDRGPLASAPLSEAGEYQLTTRQPGDGAVVGSHRIYFLPTERPSTTTATGMVGPRPTPPPFVPEKYRSPETSQLTAQVGADSNRFDFQLND